MSLLVLLDIDLTLILGKKYVRTSPFKKDRKIQRQAFLGSFVEERMPPNGIFGIDKTWYFIYQRPYVKEFLKELFALKDAGKIEIGVVTAASETYATAVFEHLLGKDFDFSRFHVFLTRDSLIYPPKKMLANKIQDAGKEKKINVNESSNEIGSKEKKVNGKVKKVVKDNNKENVGKVIEKDSSNENVNKVKKVKKVKKVVKENSNENVEKVKKVKKVVKDNSNEVNVKDNTNEKVDKVKKVKKVKKVVKDSNNEIGEVNKDIVKDNSSENVDKVKKQIVKDNSSESVDKVKKKKKKIVKDSSNENVVGTVKKIIVNDYDGNVVKVNFDLNAEDASSAQIITKKKKPMIYFKDLDKARKKFKGNILMIDDKYSVFFQENIANGELALVAPYSYPPIQKKDQVLLETLRFIRCKCSPDLQQVGIFFGNQVKPLLPNLSVSGQIVNDPFQIARLKALHFLCMVVDINPEDDIFFNSMALFDRFFVDARKKRLEYVTTVQAMVLLMYSCIALTRAAINPDRREAKLLNISDMTKIRKNLRLVCKDRKKYARIMEKYGHLSLNMFVIPTHVFGPLCLMSANMHIRQKTDKSPIISNYFDLCDDWESYVYSHDKQFRTVRF